MLVVAEAVAAAAADAPADDSGAPSTSVWYHRQRIRHKTPNRATPSEQTAHRTVHTLKDSTDVTRLPTQYSGKPKQNDCLDGLRTRTGAVHWFEKDQSDPSPQYESMDDIVPICIQWEYQVRCRLFVTDQSVAGQQRHTRTDGAEVLQAEQVGDALFLRYT